MTEDGGSTTLGLTVNDSGARRPFPIVVRVQASDAYWPFYQAGLSEIGRYLNLAFQRVYSGADIVHGEGPVSGGSFAMCSNAGVYLPEPPTFLVGDKGVRFTQSWITVDPVLFWSRTESERYGAILHELWHAFGRPHETRSQWHPTIMGTLPHMTFVDRAVAAYLYPESAINGGAGMVTQPREKWVMTPWPDGAVTTQSFGVNGHRGLDKVAGYRTLYRNPYSRAIIHEHVAGDGYGGGTFGNHVVLQPCDAAGKPTDPEGWTTLVAHLDAFYLDVFGNGQNGRMLLAGAPIGYEGFTGLVEPPGQAGDHSHTQVDCLGGLTVDISLCRDPATMLEEDLMDAAMQEMMTIANGNFERARVIYNALLVAPPVFDEQDLTGGHLDPTDVGLNAVLTRQRVLMYVALTNAAAAIARVP